MFSEPTRVFSEPTTLIETTVHERMNSAALIDEILGAVLGTALFTAAIGLDEIDATHTATQRLIERVGSAITNVALALDGEVAVITIGTTDDAGRNGGRSGQPSASTTPGRVPSLAEQIDRYLVEVPNPATTPVPGLRLVVDLT